MAQAECPFLCGYEKLQCEWIAAQMGNMVWCDADSNRRDRERGGEFDWWV